MSATTGAVPSPEPRAWVALLPAALTGVYYLLPSSLQHSVAVQLLPQGVSYLALLFWARLIPHPAARLGLSPLQLSEGLRWGAPTGAILGLLNVAVILWVVPRLGGDILFLTETPHAQTPPLVMLPWLVVAIAVFVEVNFRGFLLGRLLVLWQRRLRPEYHKAAPALAVGASALLFAFDPFMVATFKHLHWIAVWDGLVWGTLLIRRGALTITIVAHATEVMILYGILRLVLPA